MQKLNNTRPTKVQQGLIISYFGAIVEVQDEEGQVFQCHLRRNQDIPVVGDRVEWQLENDNMGTVLAIKPRSSLLARGTHRGQMKGLAANVDVLALVMASLPVFSDYLIDRYLVASELLNIPAMVVLNKIDLLSDAERKQAEASLAPYRQIPYPIFLISAISKEGLSLLATYLQNKMSVLVGPSGVGKSSIITALSNETVRVGTVSDKGIGKHTTTATHLYQLSQGGQVIDSPGVREFNLWTVDKQDILRGFKEFHIFNHCKFRDCSHLVEPQCAVQQAVNEGKISVRRFKNYQKLMNEAVNRKT